MIVSIVAPSSDWRGCFIAPWGVYSFDRSYSGTEWLNWLRYLKALGATEAEAKETLLHGPASAAAECASASDGAVTAVELLALLNAQRMEPAV